MKRIGFVLVSAALFVCAVIYFCRPKPQASISFRVSGYVGKNINWFPGAIISLTNNGPAMVRFSYRDSNEPVLLRAECPTGWVSQEFHPAGFSFSPVLLAAGSNVDYGVPLPNNTLRWQLKYTLRTASSRDRIRFKLMGGTTPGWGDRIYEWCGGLLSTNEGPPTESWSPVFETAGEIVTTDRYAIPGWEAYFNFNP